MNAYQLKFWPAVQRDLDRDLDIDHQNYDYFQTITSSLSAVVRQDDNCLSLYRDPRKFFNSTYLTAELKQLFKEVLGGLCGQPHGKNAQMSHIFPLVGDRDFSQTFLCLYHLTKHRPELSQVPQLFSLPNPESVQVAALTEFDLDIHSSIEVEPGLRIFTPWGYLAWQLGGSFAYSLLKIHDAQRVAPSQYLLRQLMGDRPTLILLQSFVDYVQQTVNSLGSDALFSQQLLIFIQNLTAVVEELSNTVLVCSLPANQASLVTAVETLVNPNDETNGNNHLETSNSIEPPNTVETRNHKETPNFRPSHNPVETRNKVLHSKINPQIQEYISENTKDIAVVSLDEHTYYSRSVSTPKRRKTTVTKIWTTGARIKTVSFVPYLIKNTHHCIKGERVHLNFVNPFLKPKHTDKSFGGVGVRAKHSDSKCSVFTNLNNESLYQWHKLSKIDLCANQIIARSPPK